MVGLAPAGPGRAWGQDFMVQAQEAGVWLVSGAQTAGAALAVPWKGGREAVSDSLQP